MTNQTSLISSVPRPGNAVIAPLFARHSKPAQLATNQQQRSRLQSPASRALAVAFFLALTQGLLPAQSVEKVADLSFVSVDGVGVGGYAPLARLTQAGTNLWFTTKSGGTFDAGTISRYDLVTREVVQVASLDNTTGKAPESSLLVVDDEAYFTTVNGGVGNKGTIAKINLSSGGITVLHNFATNGIPTGATPRAGLTRVGDELWATTSSGGISNRGVIVKYRLNDGVTSLVADFDGPALGGQPFGGLTAVGANALFFTTFSGGSTFGATGLPLGAGTLGKVTIDALGNATVGKLADLPAGYTQFPGVEPTLVGTNSLYFGTTGPNSAPGAIVRYDLDTAALTNLFSFRTNAVDALAYGTRPGYSGLVEWLGELYFLGRQGGVSNYGVVAKFNLASNTVTKLADLEGTGGLALGSATGIFDNTGVIVEETNRFFLYYAVTGGGVNNKGTILRVALPPPPIAALLAAGTAPETLALSWTGGYPPFTVQGRGDLTGGIWTNVLEGVTTRAVSLPVSGPQAVFRVQGSN